ncbi:FAST kinase domain-containing protein 1, mitochondrial [Alosa sapidissima]|uniref:FAST kinase domain-containing protein 1, mitochondrial n=1 Tax=Alosa sapidissima TaxID=34773 RepID=UPI001C08E4A4|nr:FAST kinase domain-containing protein 1, mitochondrial [Alosa sapidissima]
MLRLTSLRLCTSQRRFLRLSPLSRDQVMDQLQACSGEDQVLEVVGRHKAKLSVGHVGCAMGLLWHFQKERPELLRTIKQVRQHPQFLTLRVLAENKISQMDDSMVVDMLYDALRLCVEPHDSFIQQLVTEAWNRLDRLQMPTLSKFSICLNDQYLQHSTLMGEITEILRQKLHLINDARVLTTLMISISSLSSPRLRDALIKKADVLLDSMDPTKYNNPRRVVQFMRNSKHTHRPLLEKCNRLLLLNVPQMSAEDIFIITGLYQTLQFNNCDFRLASRQRLLELVDASSDPGAFTKLFATLGPMVNQDTRERLEGMALLLADELNGQQALAVAETLEELQCRNPQLINKFASILHKNLDHFRPVEIVRATQTLMVLHYQSPDIYNRLRTIMLKFLQSSVFPYEVTMLTRILSMLPSPRLDETALARVEAVLPQCNLNDLNTHAQAIAKWLRHDPTYLHSTPSRYVRLLQSLIRCGHERLGHADRLELLLEELRYLSGEWFEEMLLEESVAACRRLVDQISPGNVPDVAIFLTRTNYLSPHLLDRIAQVALENIQQIHFSATYATLLPFAVLNYDTPLVDELFNACIQRLTPHISSFDPHLLVLLAYALALADYFPEEVIKEIFTVDFLAKLDSQLETLPDALNMRIRLRLMELNRAVCLECPEYQVPWFHERYCKQQQKRGNGSVTPVQQQIHKMLGEVLGGINCARVAVLTPYFYTVDFECVLDRQGQPVPYSMPSQLQISEEGKVQWVSDTTEERTELPAGAQRIALDFLGPRSFCKNSRHRKGEVLLRKRHLEILGYHVIQIPHYEWNSMELSTHDAWQQYLKKRIFHDLP